MVNVPVWIFDTIIQSYFFLSLLSATPVVTDYLSLGRNYMMSLPWFSPVCVTVEPLQEGDTAMDYVEGIAQRTKLPLTDTLDSLKKVRELL